MIHSIPGISEITSPCIGVCTLDDGGRCIGCLRTDDEIARWASMSEAERQRVIEQLPRRAEDD